MAYEIEPLCLSYPANSDLSAKQFYIGYLTTAGNVAVCNSATPVLGIIQDDPDTAGEACSIAVANVAKCYVNGSDTAIAIMDWIAPNDTGIGVKTTTDKDQVVGKALEAATGSGVLIPVQIIPVTIDV